MQVSQSVPFCGEGNQDTAEGVVHCRGQTRQSDSVSSPDGPLDPAPSPLPSPYSPFWARAQKLRCKWA